MQTYINASQENGRRFVLNDMTGEIIMLNMLRFKEIADYTNHPDLDPGIEVSGKAAYDLYIEKTLPFLEQVGSKVLFEGNASSYLIGPETAHWDKILLVSHVSKEVFLKFAQNKEYLKIAGHREAALMDSRLLPINNQNK